MKISEMIEILENMKKQYGDLPLTHIGNYPEARAHYLDSTDFGVTAIIDGKNNRFCILIK